MEPIRDPLDEGIKEVVELLRANDINTFTSCEGGEGHAFAMPTIRINPNPSKYMDEEEIEISKILANADYGGYYLKLCHAYQNDVRPWDAGHQHFIEIEFWTYPLCKNSDKLISGDEPSISPFGDV